MNISFSAPWGRKVILITILTGSLLLILPAIQFIILRATQAPPRSIWVLLTILVVPPAVLLGCAFFMIRGYALDAGRLIVQRLLWSNTLDLGDLEAVYHDPEATKRSIKIIGNDGLFAMCGTFRNKTLGRYRAYITDPKRAVVLKLRTRTVVVTPDDPKKFIRELQRTFPRLANAPERSCI
jgi:hypothetical protein